MFRIGGAKVALLTFACDALKGYLPMIVARFLGFGYVGHVVLSQKINKKTPTSCTTPLSKPCSN